MWYYLGAEHGAERLRLRLGVVGVRGLFSYEGARSFVTDICCTYGDSPYKMDMGRHNDGRPSPKPAISELNSARPKSPSPSRSTCRAPCGAGARHSMRPAPRICRSFSLWHMCFEEELISR
jgi:hypothetical protein